ncbi:DUF333 domain-containing protein [Candidatus Falkowbacteria bacterium]|nr:DUF333 domain-containing protein [Candidatus Falkowbacteria bacterium]
MKKKYIIFPLFILLFILSACGQKAVVKEQEPVSADDLKPGLVVVNRQDKGAVKEVGEEEKRDDVVKKAGLANPASTYCQEQGYELETRKEKEGEKGFCVFDDEEECEEWAFYKGECGEKYRQE